MFPTPMSEKRFKATFMAMTPDADPQKHRNVLQDLAL
jgi:hypothetical protein